MRSGASTASAPSDRPSGRTPVPIIVPCHRVIGTSGDLVGYGGGLARKLALLELESDVSGSEPLPALWSARQLALL